jgi:glycosyltransferase involved in cell wall biosynthesis
MTSHNRILFLSHKPECGGAEKSLLDLLGSLDRDRFDPHLITSGPGGLADEAASHNVPIHFIKMDFSGKGQRLVGLLQASRRLARLQANHRFDLIHANTIHAGYVAVLSRTGLPLVWHLRDSDYPFIGRKMATCADLLIANSRATAQMFPAHWVESGRVRVIYNGIDPLFFKPARPSGFLHRSLGIPPAVPLVGLVGRLSPWKGQADLIQAAALVKEDAHFLIIGGQPFIGEKADRGYPQYLAEIARSSSAADRIHLLGHRQDVARIMGELSILVHPSRKPEPFGRDLAEGQALGLPVVGSAEGGVVEIIENGKNGLLIPPGSASALAAAIDRLLGHPDEAAGMGKRGRRRAMQRFTADRHARQVEQAYTLLLH